MNRLRIRTQITQILFTAMAVVCLLSGCATKTDLPLFQGESLPVSDGYLIGAGDGLKVTVWRNPEVSTAVTVRPDGKITTPLVEDLIASGKTPSQLARDIETALAKYIQQPIVTVIVTEFVGPYAGQIRVIGQATKPKALSYRQGMSLMDVLISVGGVTEFASGNKASIIRDLDGRRVRVPVRLDDLLKEGDITADMPMRPGDVLVIPESFF